MNLFARIRQGVFAPAGSSAQTDNPVLENALVQGIAIGIPGISVAIGVGDEVVWTGTAGFNDVLRQVPVTVNDRFGVGSIGATAPGGATEA